MYSRLRTGVCGPRTLQITRLSLHSSAAELNGVPRPDRRSSRRFSRHCTQAASLANEKKRKSEEEEDPEEEEFDDLSAEDDSTALTTQQVQTLLNVVCDETEIAEIELQIGGFSMKMRRKLTAFPSSSQSPAQAAAQPHSAVELPFQSTASMDESQLLSSPQSTNGSTSSMEEDDLFEENLLYIGSPKVGILRRARYIKGKKVGKGPLVEVGASVKKGQTLAYIEQLGTFVPVEAPQAGEITSIVAEDGKAVEYKQIILELSPFFGGHIIGDKKYA